MKSTIHDRLRQMRQAGVTDSAETLGGHVGKKGSERTAAVPARAKGAAPPDSPRDVHGGATGKDTFAAARPAATETPTATGAAASLAPLTLRGKLVAARVVLEQRSEGLKRQLHTAEQLVKHAEGQLEAGDPQVAKLAEVFKLSGPTDTFGHLLGRPVGGRPGEVLRLSDAAQTADHLANNIRRQLGAPAASWRDKIEANDQQLRHLNGLMGLEDHELGNLAATRAALPTRLSQVEAQLHHDQDAMVAASMRGDPARALTQKVFAGRQELVRLSQALQGLDGLRGLAEG